jgi:hypothetical protein
LLHVFFRAAIDGLAVRGPMLGKQHAYVLVREWLGAQPQVEREWALRELARRYLSGHGPASDRDLARWAGLPLRDVRAGFAQLDLVERDGLLDLPGKPPPAQLPPPRLLGAFDPLLHGWIDRSAIIASAHTRRVLDGGMFWPFALARGRAVARWKLEKNRVALDPFEPVGAGERAASNATRPTSSATSVDVAGSQSGRPLPPLEGTAHGRSADTAPRIGSALELPPAQPLGVLFRRRTI